MPIYTNYSDITITNAGGIIDLNISDPISFYNVDGTGIVLANDLDITTSDPGVKGVTYNINYDGNGLDINGHDLTIFGVILTAAQALIKLQITSYYDGTDWITTVKPSVDTEFVASANISSAGLGITDLDDDANTEVIVVPLSFESGEQCANLLPVLPWAWEISRIDTVVVKAIAGTDNGTITISEYGVGDIDTITVAASSALNTVDSVVPSDSPHPAFSTLALTTSKTTSGGKVIATIKLIRRP